MSRANRAALTLAAALGASPLSAAEPAAPWAPAAVSGPQFESHPAFDPLTGDLYFVRSTPRFEGWRILRSRCTAAGWSEPAPPPFVGDGVEADPYFTPDGRSLYFISTRTTDGVKRGDLDLWRVDRAPGGGWGTPERLPAPVNSDAQEWFPRPASDGWLYFGSARGGGLGKTDLWRARTEGARGWVVENLGPALNTPEDEYEPLPSPDGASMVLMAADGLYRSRREGDGWSKREKLGPEINVNGTEIGPLWSPSGRTLLFARDTRGPASGEFFVARLGGEEPWPPACPGGAPVPLTDAGAIRVKTQELVDAVAPGHVAVWRDLLDDRMVHVDENGVVRTKSQLLEELGPLPAGLVGSLRVDSFRVEVHGDVAVATHEEDERLDYHGQHLRTRFRMTDTWKRTDSGWRLIGQQVAAVLEDPPALAAPLDPTCPYAGRYVLSGNTDTITTTMRCEGDHLVSVREARPPATFRPETADVFFQPGQPRSRRIFRRDASGAVIGFVDRREGRDLAWRKLAS
jgi:hypothetical protein